MMSCSTTENTFKINDRIKVPVYHIPVSLEARLALAHRAI